MMQMIVDLFPFQILSGKFSENLAELYSAHLYNKKL